MALRFLAGLVLRPLAFLLVAVVIAWRYEDAVRMAAGAFALVQLVIVGVRLAMWRRVDRAILANLPDPVVFTPLDEPAPRLAPLEGDLAVLGFEPAGAYVRVNVATPAPMRPFTLPGRPVYATAFLAGGVVPGFDFVSVVAGERGGLTTSTNPQAATVPSAPGALRQVFPGASLEQALRHHLDAVQALEARGVRFDPATPELFERAFARSFARARQAFLARRLEWTAEALQRIARRAFPDQGSVIDRPDTQETIRALAA